MKKYAVRDREAGNIIEIVNSLEEAEKLIANFEESDKNEGIYEEDFYEAVEFAECDQIREIRKRAGLTQQAFAETFGIPMRTLQGWELGERTPADYIVDMLEKTARYRALEEEEKMTSWSRAHADEIAIKKINDNPTDFLLLVNGQEICVGTLEDQIAIISEIEKWEDIEKLLEPAR